MMSKAPLVSIIIPCYNAGKYLREAVASAQSQTYAPCEIIIVNDHSSDVHTCTVLEQLAAEGVSVITTPEGGKGPSAARNAGIFHATGVYILPLDADDKIAQTYVEKSVNVLETRSDIHICYCRASLFGLKQGTWDLPPYDPDVLLYRNMIFVTALFRKIDWEAVGGYDEEAQVGLEDHSFWLAMHARGYRAWQLPEILFSYRIRKNSMIAEMANAERHSIARARLFERNADYIRHNAHILFNALDAALEREGREKCLVSYKILKPFFRLEWSLRQCVKRFLGRA